MTVHFTTVADNVRSFTVLCPFNILGEVMVSVLDFKREVGLWHSILTVRLLHITNQ